MADQGLGAVRATDHVPALPHIIIDSGGHHGLAGMRCAACGAVVIGARLACPACGARGSSENIRLADHGVVRAHTVVHRSFPGVATPFVAVVVDLDGGGSVRGTLTDVDPLAELPVGMRVETVFREAGQHDREGRPFLCYFFVPEKDQAR